MSLICISLCTCVTYTFFSSRQPTGSATTSGIWANWWWPPYMCNFGLSIMTYDDDYWVSCDLCSTIVLHLLHTLSFSLLQVHSYQSLFCYRSLCIPFTTNASSYGSQSTPSPLFAKKEITKLVFAPQTPLTGTLTHCFRCLVYFGEIGLYISAHASAY